MLKQLYEIWVLTGADPFAVCWGIFSSWVFLGDSETILLVFVDIDVGHV